MSKLAHHDQTLTQYLLGALSEAEVERLDERSFTDDEFAAALQAAENDLVDAYVQGELTGMTLEQFKSHYLASPHRREQVEFAQAFQFVAKKNLGAQALTGVETDALDKSAANHSGAWQVFSLNSFQAPRAAAVRWAAAFAALALLLVAGGWLALENARLRGQVAEAQAQRDELSRREQELREELAGERAVGAETEQELARGRAERERLAQELKEQEAQAQHRDVPRPSPAPGGVSIASLVLVPQLRDAGQVSKVSIPPHAEYVSVRLELEPNDYTSYRVTLLNPTNNQTLWRSGTLRAYTKGARKSLNLRLQAGLLQPQTYTLRVAGISAAGASPEIISDYPFRVMK